MSIDYDLLYSFLPASRFTVWNTGARNPASLAAVAASEVGSQENDLFFANTPEGGILTQNTCGYVRAPGLEQGVH